MEERKSQCTWGYLTGKFEGTTVTNADGTETHTEVLPLLTFSFTTDKPPVWAAGDPELWKLTRLEWIEAKRQKEFGIQYEARIAEKQKEIEILKESFRIFDMDDSGALETDEVIEILTRVGGGNAMSKQDAKEFIEMFDQNGDGKMQVGECEQQQPASPHSRGASRAALRRAAVPNAHALSHQRVRVVVVRSHRRDEGSRRSGGYELKGGRGGDCRDHCGRRRGESPGGVCLAGRAGRAGCVAVHPPPV